MTEERIKWILELIKKYDSHNYGEATCGSADVWGGSTAWGYEITYNPQTQMYLWEDTEDIGGGFNTVDSFQLSEAQVIEKLREIQKS
ncbi:MAG: hypothetical protein ACKVTZ_14920 [Bacteroidia bacterium]